MELGKRHAVVMSHLAFPPAAGWRVHDIWLGQAPTRSHRKKLDGCVWGGFLKVPGAVCGAGVRVGEETAPKFINTGQGQLSSFEVMGNDAS